ncbi:DUF413 domain-containing protein [Vibrio aerogenes]
MGQHQFEDHENFPDGFVESGHFTDAEEEMLVYWGETMMALACGELEPVNEEEAHFIFILAHPKLAMSPLEKVWLKYCDITCGSYLATESLRKKTFENKAYLRGRL